jgi:hypothetical protein
MAKEKKQAAELPAVRMETSRKFTRFDGTSKQNTRRAELYAAKLERDAKDQGRILTAWVIGDPWGVWVESVERRRVE